MPVGKVFRLTAHGQTGIPAAMPAQDDAPAANADWNCRLALAAASAALFATPGAMATPPTCRASTEIVANGDNLLVGSYGLNTLIGGAGIDTMWGGTQTDMIGGSGTTYMYGDVDTITGSSSSADTFTGGASSMSSTFMATDQGNNTFNLGGGNDTIWSGGNDTINANLATSGNASIYGGVDGNKTVVNVTGSYTGETVNGGVTTITFAGSSAHDTLTVTGSTINLSGATKV